MVEEVISGKFKDMRSIWHDENFPIWITWVLKEIFAFMKFHLGQEFMVAKIEDNNMNSEIFFFHTTDDFTEQLFGHVSWISKRVIDGLLLMLNQPTYYNCIALFGRRIRSLVLHVHCPTVFLEVHFVECQS